MASNDDNIDVAGDDELNVASLQRIIVAQQRQIDRLSSNSVRQEKKLDELMMKLQKVILVDSTNNNNCDPGDKQRHKQTVKNQKTSMDNINERTAIDQLAAMMATHDHREAPRPENFSGDSGKSLEKFFQQFENYCYSRFVPGTMEQWTGELGKFLQGDILDMFKAFGGGERDYSVMKVKLLEYYEGLKDQRENRKHQEFIQATMQHDERLYTYALRIERLYCAINQCGTVQDSAELKLKFMSSIPPRDAQELEQQMCLMKAINKTMVLTWKDLVQYLRSKYDIEIATQSTKTDKTMGKSNSNSAVWYSSSTLENPNNNSNLVKFLNAASQEGPKPYSRINNSEIWAEGNYGFGDTYYDRSRPRTRGGHNYRGYDRTRSRDNYRGRAGPRGNGRGRFRGNERGRGRYNRSRSRNNVESGERFPGRCHYCQIKGHKYDDCWRRLGYCTRCGSDQHDILACPLMSGQSRSQSQVRYGADNTETFQHEDVESDNQNDDLNE